MNKQDSPTTFGAFKSVGLTAIAFHRAVDLEAAQVKRLTLGLVSPTVIHYTASG